MPQHTFFETYPATQARRLGLDPTLSKKSPATPPTITAQLSAHIAAPFNPAAVTAWHHVDALLCRLTAERHAQGLASSHGHAAEGLILL